jgi:alpha-galactosidase
MLFRRRYNTAAIVTIAAVATVLFLLAAIPLAGNGRGAAAPAATGTAAGAGPNATYRLVTYEAEAPGNTLVGSATVGAYQGASGGRLVRAIGNWGSPRGTGALRFTNVDVPRGGPYVLTFYFVNIGANATRTAVVTASGSQSNPVTVVSDSLCCTAQPMVVFLSKGRNTITFSNSAGEAPAIDRITLKVPLS